MATVTVIIGLVGLLALVVSFIVSVGREIIDLGGIIGYFSTPLSARERELLTAYSPFYRSLSAQRRREFAKRVKHFIYEKEWVGKGVEVTREMQLRIAATATQLTFGFDQLLLLHFNNILVFPDAYMERTTGQRLLGGTMPGRRTVAISWKHFMEGINDPSDGRHLGLHELAHAVWLENRIPNEEDDFLDSAAMDEWRRLAEQEAALIRKGHERLFRDYAATDQAEFFAVAVEYFFEQPTLFKTQLPELYGCLCNLLKQDPAAWSVRS